MNFFENLKSYEKYLEDNPFHEKLGIDLKNYGHVERKIVPPAYHAVSEKIAESFEAELDDLVRLHYLIRLRKVTTILEFGVGKSTIVFDHALEQNKRTHLSFVEKNLRRANPFTCFSVDNNQQWISTCQAVAETPHVSYHLSKCSVSNFNGRICTYYDQLPNVCPDFIYLDGPDLYSPVGDVRGISTGHSDRLPMAADILAMEHFLLPGTLIVVDGRTANARFLKTNLQRQWTYFHYENFDQHFFELTEKPLGVYNQRQIEFCLGAEFFTRIKNFEEASCR